MLKREHFPGSPKTGHDFIKNQENVMPITPVPQTGQHAGGPDPHPGNSLHKRLYNNGGGLLSFQAFQIFDRSKTFDGKLIASKPIMELGNPTET
jgi:hypothetical protein